MNVTLTVWRVPVYRAPQVAWRLVSDRRKLRRTPGVRFAKLLGTSSGFTGMDLTRWAALTVADRTEIPALARWRRLATAHCRLELRPLTSRGRWACAEPFNVDGGVDEEGGMDEEGGREAEEMVLALTRARLRPARAVRFWRAIGPVAVAAGEADGLLAAFGIGEAPIGWQGTVSLWRSRRDLVGFAYRHPHHRRVIDRTPEVGWYAEELYARFAVHRIDGDPAVIGWAEGSTA